MFLDGLDGRVARLTSTSSEFGKEYDSLSDMVSFGLAPAIVTYQWGVERLAEYGAIWGRLGWLAAFLYCAAAAFRLARFNTNVGQDRRFFQGLPSPPAAASSHRWSGSRRTTRSRDSSGLSPASRSPQSRACYDVAVRL